MSVFEPEAVRCMLRNTVPKREQAQFESRWAASVESRLTTWGKKHSLAGKVAGDKQLRWAAEVVEYVSYLYSKSKLHGNAKSGKPPSLPADILILGPRFVPPSYLHIEKRKFRANVEVETTYLKSLNIVHPFYYPRIGICPECRGTKVGWEGWTPTGPRNVYGIRRPELAIGYQLRCHSCSKGDSQFSFVTTSKAFWKNWEVWKIPRDIPVFFKSSAVSHELFDLIVELRLRGTSSGLAENIKQLHLLEYHQAALNYLEWVQQRNNNTVDLCELQVMSAPWEEGYDSASITDDVVTKILLKYSDKTRHEESAEYERSLLSGSLSVDATYKSAKKATVTSTELTCTNLLRGGLLSAVNEKNEIVAWRMCQTGTNAELEEMLMGLQRRHTELVAPMPDSVTADNCCSVRNAILKVFPNADVNLDVWHFKQRYVVSVVNGAKNPYRTAISQDVVNAVLISRADDEKPAKYRTKEEQETRLEAMFQKWSEKGDVWSAAASKVHADQLAHVRKGCLARRRQDIATDGSRIEGSHKGWNAIMRSFASGIEVFRALGSDHVLRRNIRVASSSAHPTPFIVTTHASHNIRLVNYTGMLWNTLLSRLQKVGKAKALKPRPLLPMVDSGETFGLVISEDSLTFGGLITMKDEDADEDDLLAEEQRNAMGTKLGIDALQFHLPHRSTKHSELEPTSSVQSTTFTTAVIAPPPDLALAHLPLPAAPSAPSELHFSITKAAQSDAPEVLPDRQDVTKLDKGKGRAPATHTTDLQSIGEPPFVDLTSDDADCTGLPRAPVQSGAREAPLKRKVVASDGLEPATKKLCRWTEESSRVEVESSSTLVVQGSKNATVGAAVREFFKVKTVESLSATCAIDSEVQELGAIPQGDEGRSSSESAVTASIPPALITPLPQPASLRQPRLSRSQQLFASCTGMNTHALTLGQGTEFFIFMELRMMERWASFSMTPRRWVAATATYNEQLKAAVQKTNERLVSTGHADMQESFIEKHPRALADQLTKVEAMVTQRIMTNNYRSQKGTETFWRRHCAAVSLVRVQNNGTKRQPQTCKRCNCVKYQGGLRGAQNHRKQCCSDGVLSLMKVADPPPPWPQPEGIFVNGRTFNVTSFFTQIRLIYEAVVVNDQRAEDLSLEQEAFGRFLNQRLIVTTDGCALFPLYEAYEVVPTMPELLLDFNGRRCLRVDCLSDEAAAGRLPVGASEVTNSTEGSSSVRMQDAWVMDNGQGSVEMLRLQIEARTGLKVRRRQVKEKEAAAYTRTLRTVQSERLRCDGQAETRVTGHRTFRL